MLSPKITALDKVISLACREKKKVQWWEQSVYMTWNWIFPFSSQRFQQGTLLIQHFLCWGQIHCLVCDKKIQSQTNQNPQKCQSKIMTVYGRGKKWPFPAEELVEFLLLHITHWSVPRPSTRGPDFTRPVPHEQGDRSEHPITGNNTHLLPMNGESDLTDRTSGNNLKLWGNVSAYGQEVKICNTEKS